MVDEYHEILARSGEIIRLLVCVLEPSAHYQLWNNFEDIIHLLLI